MKTKIEIKTLGGSVLFAFETESNTIKKTLEEAKKQGADLQGAYLQGAYLQGAYLQGADLQGAYLQGADLQGADLQGFTLAKLPKDYVNQCSRDMLFVFEHLKAELPGLRKALVEGKVDGSQYEGECACLIGTIANLDGSLDKVCSMIPFYDRGTQNMGETWFLNIKPGDMPENNAFSKHAVDLIDMILVKAKKKEG